MITTLIFDLGGVLINLDCEACVNRYNELGISNANELLGIYKQAGVFLQLEQGLLSPTEFCTSIRKIAGRFIPDEDIYEALNRCLLDIPTEKLEMLLQLRKRYRVLLLSNTNTIHFSTCKKLFQYNDYQLSDFFDKCYLSYEMNLSKPNPDIFRELLRQERIKADECFFLDDSPANIQTAQTLGFQTYLVENGQWLHLFCTDNN